MDPHTVSAISAVAALIKELGTWPIGSILLVVLFGPWVITFFVNRQQEKRFESVKRMYESNVKLVESYEKVAEVQSEVITLNTAKWCEALDGIKLNQFCPLARIRKQKMEDIPNEHGR